MLETMRAECQRECRSCGLPCNQYRVASWSSCLRCQSLSHNRQVGSKHKPKELFPCLRSTRSCARRQPRQLSYGGGSVFCTTTFSDKVDFNLTHFCAGKTALRTVDGIYFPPLPQAHGRSPFTRDTGDRGHNISEASDSRARPLDDGSGGKRNSFCPPQTPNFNVDSVRVNAAVVLTRLFNIEIGGQGNGSGGGK